jgi:hypothetical protein
MTQYQYEEEITTDPYLGTSFLNGAYSGIKSSPTPQEAINYARGYIMDVTDEGIKIQTIYASGKLGPSWTVTNRDSNDSYTATKEELMDSISYEYNEETSTVTFNWSKAFYGNVKKIYINETYRNEIGDYSVFPTSSYTKLKLKDIVSGYDYRFEAKVIFEDGTTETKEFILQLHKPLDITLTDQTINITPLEGVFRFEVYKFKVYVNGTFVGEFKYLNGVTDVTTYALSNINVNDINSIKLVATDRNEKEIYFIEEYNK